MREPPAGDGAAARAGRVYLGMGSNLGDRRLHLSRARDRIGALPDTRLRRQSCLYETTPIGPEQPCFLNAVVEVETALSAPALLDSVLRIEREAGRERGERWGPRSLDIDLLLHGSLVCRDPGLSVPHPELPRRGFVLVPLVELAPDLQVPGLGQTTSQLLCALDPDRLLAEGAVVPKERWW